eukprot:jgi/Astpho2/3730/fgenesh1_pg.00060_%23_40_t
MAAPGKCLWFLVWQLCICSCPQRANRSRLHVQVEARPTVRTFIKTVREIKMVEKEFVVETRFTGRERELEDQRKHEVVNETVTIDETFEPDACTAVEPVLIGGSTPVAGTSSPFKRV